MQSSPLWLPSKVKRVSYSKTDIWLGEERRGWAVASSRGWTRKTTFQPDPNSFSSNTWKLGQTLGLVVKEEYQRNVSNTYWPNFMSRLASKSGQQKSAVEDIQHAHLKYFRLLVNINLTTY